MYIIYVFSVISVIYNSAKKKKNNANKKLSVGGRNTME